MVSHVTHDLNTVASLASHFLQVFCYFRLGFLYMALTEQLLQKQTSLVSDDFGANYACYVY